jgi:Rrf2 family transcriptional regulator, iron-responsive regulator
MKLSRSSAYAVRAVVAMASNPGQAPSHATAKAVGIPPLFLLKLLNPLVRAGLLKSVKGPHGGYRLAKPACEITLLEVVEAVDGPIRGEAGDCLDGLRDQLQAVLSEASAEARGLLGAVTVADLASAAAPAALDAAGVASAG